MKNSRTVLCGARAEIIQTNRRLWRFRRAKALLMPHFGFGSVLTSVAARARSPAERRSRIVERDALDEARQHFLG